MCDRVDRVLSSMSIEERSDDQKIEVCDRTTATWRFGIMSSCRTIKMQMGTIRHSRQRILIQGHD